MRTVVFISMTFASGLCLWLKGQALRRDPGNVFLQALCTTWALVLLASIVGLPPVMTWLETSTGVLAIWYLVPSFTSVVAARCLLVLWTAPLNKAKPQVRLGVIVCAIVISTYVVLAVGGRGSVPPRDASVVPEMYWAAVPAASNSFILDVVLLAGIYLDIAVRLARVARVVDRRWLYRGLRVLLASALLLFAYCASCAVYHVAYRLSVDAGALLPALFAGVFPVQGLGVVGVADRLGMDLGTLQPVWYVCLGFGVVGAVVGFLLPALGPRWDRMRAYRRLRRLWLALGQAAPQILLKTPRLSLLDAWNPWDIDFRLYRRAIEIRDGLQLFRPYFDPAVADAARSLGQDAKQEGNELTTTIVAAQLRAAIRGRASGRKPNDRVPLELSQAGTGSLDGELKVLVPLAAAFRSPIAEAASVSVPVSVPK